jgi:L-aspartate oxidase
VSADLHALDGRVAIVGGGVAGLMTALRLAPRPVALVSKTPLGAEASTLWAQGGLAAALGPDDSPELHAADTLAAGDGLCVALIVERFTRAAPQAIEELARLGVAFDRSRDGGFALGLEAAHRRRRIVHAGGDGTGRELMRALVAAARRTPSIRALEGFEARRLVVEDGAARGLLVVGPQGPLMLAADRIVIATGGVGGLYEVSTNPGGSFGQGLALAARAGAELADLEFVQFHPTAFDGPTRPAPLVSEAVRGEGAVLVDETGERFMADVPGAELAPRDVVARAIWRRRAEGHRVFLDARQALGEKFAARFPVIAAFCREAGVDPARQPIPVRPAAHYHMGGIAVDEEGRSSLRGLWACGEAAATGLHGANRLASNSLTEAVVFAGAVADSVAGASFARGAPLRAVKAPSAADPSAVRPILSAAAGVMREGKGLARAVAALAPLALGAGPSADPAAVALMIALAALRREESRGAHCRTDFPDKASEARRATLRLDSALVSAGAGAPPALGRRVSA